MSHPTESALQQGAPDVLAALRAATDSRHELLDGGLSIGAADASLDDYIAHLTMLRAWLAPLAGWLSGFDDGPQADARLDVDAWLRARLALIGADLRDAGVDPATLPVATAEPWPERAGAAWRWGVCYVVEGSQLGGAVLYGRLQARLAPHALRYLKGEDVTSGSPAGAAPGPRWRQFMQALRARVRTPADIAEACAGACDAFDRILALRAHVRA